MPNIPSTPPDAPAIRIAAVQHGDFLGAANVASHGGPETYFGMHSSVTALTDLMQSRAGLVISLDAPKARGRVGHIECVGMPEEPMLSGRVTAEMRARRVLAEIERFRPTHVLIRTMIFPGLKVARWCVKTNTPGLAMLATAMWEARAIPRLLNRLYMSTLNAPIFARVYNYKQPACDSMVEFGLDASKVFAYQFDNERLPEASTTRQYTGSGCHLVFAGNMVPDKGPDDVIDCVAELRRRGIQATATLFGVGPHLEAVQRRAAELGGAIETPGKAPNDALFAAFRNCTFACVPSRPGFVEGMPMSLTEALASRTPVLASDCTVFKRAFTDGEGVRFFRAGNGADMARVAQEVLQSRDTYAALSQSTAAAFWRVCTQTTLTDALAWWSNQLEPTKS